MTHELTLAQKKGNFLQEMEKFAPQFKMALPEGVSYNRLHRVSLTAITRNPEILKCTTKSIIGAVLTCAQLGLVPDGVMNEAHFVPFWNKKKQVHECTLIPGYKGLEGLCLNSGKVRSMISRAVYENDEYSFEYGSDQKFRHIPTPGDRGEFVAAYDVATFTDGSMDFLWLWKKEIDKHKNMSQMGRKNQGTWVDHYEGMALKTAKRVHAKQLPMSAEAQRAVVLDELAGADISQNLAGEVPDIEPPKPGKVEVPPDDIQVDAEVVEAEYKRLIKKQANDTMPDIDPADVDGFFDLCDPNKRIKNDKEFNNYLTLGQFENAVEWIYKQWEAIQ